MIVYAAVIADTREVRPGEALDWSALAGYLRARLDLGAATSAGTDVQVSQFPGGHSNLTYLVRFGATELVVRRPPLGPVPPKAHDMAREYRWLEAVNPAFPLAPKPFLLCEDPSVLGTTFYVMERRNGLVVRRDEPESLAGNPVARRMASEAIVDALARLHAVDVSTGAVATLGKPEGFVARQVRGWTERWERSKTDEIPGMERLTRWLASRLPPSPRPTLVHNDFKLDNIMLDAADLSRVEAVLDWEMATVGDPLVDLGCTLCYWTEAGDPAMRGGAMSSITAEPGWLTRIELVRRYAEKTACDVSSLGYYEVFGLFKLGVILQQIYFRYYRGQTRDERFRDFHLRVRGLMSAAIELAERLD